MPRGGDRGGGVVLRREDVARRPAHVGAERLQRLDQHRRLDRHVQASRRYVRPCSGCSRANSSRIAISPGISVSAIAHLLAAPVGELQVGDPEVGELLDIGRCVHASLHRATAEGKGADSCAFPRARVAVQRAPFWECPEPGSRPDLQRLFAALLGDGDFSLSLASCGVPASAAAQATLAARPRGPAGPITAYN